MNETVCRNTGTKTSVTSVIGVGGWGTSAASVVTRGVGRGGEKRRRRREGEREVAFRSVFEGVIGGWLHTTTTTSLCRSDVCMCVVRCTSVCGAMCGAFCVLCVYNKERESKAVCVLYVGSTCNETSMNQS
jgi:hypothetical protein